MWQWWFFSCAAGLATWGFLTAKAWGAIPGDARGERTRAALLALAQLLIATFILTCGFLIEPALQAMMDPESGGPRAPAAGEIAVAFFSGLFPACVTVMSAREGKDRGERMRNAAAGAVLTLMILDNVWNILARRPLESFLFSLFADAIGGVVAGLLIALSAEFTRQVPAGAAASSRSS